MASMGFNLRQANLDGKTVCEGTLWLVVSQVEKRASPPQLATFVILTGDKEESQGNRVGGSGPERAKIGRHGSGSRTTRAKNSVQPVGFDERFTSVKRGGL
ncbi:hypothetical protein UVI_02057810 [Ustilaginoidea virens]|uniref:Uncharacterized protein n=1 Tax=Ustilaginoidea virens TaxID=1159556 RepID=A0A1B5L068_USTVR|nr:hypothetical protein UVI_02057810 [Ustilaginoidea virens]